MKKVFIVVGLFLLTVMGFYACEEFNEDNPVKAQGEARKFAVTGCKSHARPDGTRSPFEEEYIEYKALADDCLSFTHVNMAFNCEPGEIWAQAYISNDTIEVLEGNTRFGTDCICFYDLSFEVGPLERKDYVVLFKLSRRDNPPHCKFNIKYCPSLSGTFKVER